MDEAQIEAAIEAELAKDLVVVKAPTKIGKPSSAVGKPLVRMIEDVLPAEAAELYHRNFTKLAQRYGFLTTSSKWDSLDDASKALHTATWREMLSALRNPRPLADPSKLPEVLDGYDSDEPRPIAGRINRRR